MIWQVMLHHLMLVTLCTARIKMVHAGESERGGVQVYYVRIGWRHVWIYLQWCLIPRQQSIIHQHHLPPFAVGVACLRCAAGYCRVLIVKGMTWVAVGGRGLDLHPQCVCVCRRVGFLFVERQPLQGLRMLGDCSWWRLLVPPDRPDCGFQFFTHCGRDTAGWG